MSENHLTTIQSRPSKKEALEVIDQLRSDIESGKLRAFAGVAINDCDEAFRFSAAAAPTSNLRMAGAAAWLLQSIYEEA